MVASRTRQFFLFPVHFASAISRQRLAFQCLDVVIFVLKFLLEIFMK